MNKLIDFAFIAILTFVFMLVSGDKLVYCAIKVYPRLITPGVPQANENVFFDFDEYNDPKPELRVFNMAGRLVRTIQVLNPSATVSGWRQIWDGKDDSGNIVYPGVYIYQWSEGITSTTGSIVVAR